MLINGKSSIIRSSRLYEYDMIYLNSYIILFPGILVHVHLEAANCYTIQVKKKVGTSFSRHWKQKETELHIRSFGHSACVNMKYDRWEWYSSRPRNHSWQSYRVTWNIGDVRNEPSNTKWWQIRNKLIRVPANWLEVCRFVEILLLVYMMWNMSMITLKKV